MTLHGLFFVIRIIRGCAFSLRLHSLMFHRLVNPAPSRRELLSLPQLALTFSGYCVLQQGRQPNPPAPERRAIFDCARTGGIHFNE